MKFFLITFVFFSYCSRVYSFENPYILKSQKLNLSESPQWLKFLHYEKDFGIRSSEADGMSFFLHEDGKKNPRLEMEALITALIETNNHDDKSALCRFPARSRWLQSVLEMDKEYFPYDKCSAYKAFINEHLGSSIYLVFSSYYLESPASAFGHTMIRLGKREIKSENNVETTFNKQSELLDTGIGYAANSTTDNALLYAVLGIVGGFQGTYSSIPYFYKIREYNDYESRDLWSYELDLNDSQKLKFLEHLWELGGTYFDYFYFTQNCSYNLITLLDTVNPEWNLASKIPFYVIPVDTLKAVSSIAGLVKNITFRPSIKKVFEKSFSALEKEERKEMLKSAHEKNLSYIDKLPIERRAIWTDALIDYVDYQYAREVLLEKGQYYEWKKEVLAVRSQQGITPISTGVTAPPQEERPDLGHDSSRLEAGMGLVDGRDFNAKLKFRFAMHDLLDPTLGQPALASLNFFEIGLKYNLQNKKKNKTNQLQFESFKFFEVATLNPWTEFHRPLSLLAETGTKRHAGCADNESVFECQSPYLQGGLGITKATSLGSLSFFLQGDFNYSGRYDKKINIGLGPKFIGLLRPSLDWVWAVKGIWQKEFIDSKDSYTLGSELRYYFSLDVGIKQSSEYLNNSDFKSRNNFWRHDISVLYYF
jgi:hypothetical protein